MSYAFIIHTFEADVNLFNVYFVGGFLSKNSTKSRVFDINMAVSNRDSHKIFNLPSRLIQPTTYFCAILSHASQSQPSNRL